MDAQRWTAALAALVLVAGTAGTATAQTGPECAPHPSLESAPAATVPPGLSRLAGDAADDPRLQGLALGLSVWVEGYGEVGAHFADLRLLPASNQKLFTAMGAFALLPADLRLVTEVRATGPVAGGTLDGDLVLVGGGDATLRSTGSHSLVALAEQVAAAGITSVTGRVVVDESRYDGLRTAPGWEYWHLPDSVGPLSALLVDQNRYRADAAFLADPGPANAARFVEALAAAGVVVEGGTSAGARSGAVVARLASARLDDLVLRMLTFSDNMIAELLVKEIGLQTSGIGSTRAGLAAIDLALAELCVPLTGLEADGSGLSRLNYRSAREWRTLLQAAQAAPWWERLVAALPVAGETGTLRRRFLDTPAAGNARAKTGSLFVARTLSGTVSTADGRRVFFSALVNGADPRPGRAVIDELVVALAGYPELAEPEPVRFATTRLSGPLFCPRLTRSLGCAQ